MNRILARIKRWRNDPIRHLSGALRGRKNINIVQIGSNDGKSGDPLWRLLQENPSWRGLFVEPVPFLFQRLCANYPKEARFRFENSAISESTEPLDFYYLSEDAKTKIPNLPKFSEQLGSFDKNHIRSHLPDIDESLIVAARVPTLTLTQLIDKHGLASLDVLHIDTEGHDWKILRQLDLKRFRPLAILVEHQHLKADEKASALAFLEPEYAVRDLGADWFCRRKDVA